MKLQNISDKTKISEIKQSRAGIINYARYFFERTQPSCIYAFSQFKDEKDLFLLILAKKKGLFDYGKLITRDGVDAWKHPSPIEVMQEFQASLSAVSSVYLSKAEIEKFLMSLNDVNIVVEKQFEDIDEWRALSPEEKIIKKTVILTEFYKKRGKRELQRKHYEVMRERTSRGESPEDIIKRMAESNWEPVAAKATEEKEVENAWTKVKEATAPLENLEQLISVRKEIEDLRAEIAKSNSRFDKAMEEINKLSARINYLENQKPEDVVKAVRNKKEVPKAETKANFTEAELCVKPLKELKDIAVSLGIEGAENVLIPTFLIKKILAAS